MASQYGTTQWRMKQMEEVWNMGTRFKMAASAFDGQYIATLKNRHPWVEYAVHTQPKPNPTQNNKSNE